MIFLIYNSYFYVLYSCLSLLSPDNIPDWIRGTHRIALCRRRGIWSETTLFKVSNCHYATVILVISSRGFVRPPNMKKAWLYWASFIVYPSGKHVFCVQVECDYYVVNVLSVLNISKWPFQWFLARWPSSFFHHFVSAKQQKTPTPHSLCPQENANMNIDSGNGNASSK